MPDFSMESQVVKYDDDRQFVFGFFSVIEVDGDTVVDKQGDIISEAELENAAYQFVLKFREASDAHLPGAAPGQLIESIVFTHEKQEALGIDLGKVGWWGGFWIEDVEVWKKIRKGDYKAFSIEGGCVSREEVEG